MVCLSGTRVLVVEDEYLIADDIARQLSATGAIVVGPYADCPSALEAVASSAISAAILDIGLRGAKVYELAARLEQSGIPYLFYTGYSLDAVREDFRSAPRIEKPYPHGALVSLLEQLLKVTAPAL